MKNDYYLVQEDMRFSLYTKAAYDHLRRTMDEERLRNHRRVPFSDMQVKGQKLEYRFPIFDLEPVRKEIFLTNYDSI